MDKSVLPALVSISCLLASLVILVFYIFYRYSLLCRRYDKFPTYKGISWVTYIFWIRGQGKSDSLPPFTYLFQFMNGLSKLYYEEGMVLMWFLFRPAVHVFKADILQDLINSPAVRDKAAEYDIFKPILGTGIVNSNGETWSSHRKLINPSFQLLKLREYISVFNKNARILTHKFEKLLENPWIEVADDVTYCAFDVIWETTMGVVMRSQEGNEDAREYMRCIDVAKEISIHRFFRPWTHLETLFRFTRQGKQLRDATKSSYSIVRKIINEKLTLFEKQASSKETSLEVNKKKSFLETLLLTTKCPDVQFTVNDLESEAVTMIAAGVDTVSFTMQWTLLLLGMHPDIQEDVARELNEISKDGSHSYTYEDICNMKYLECVIKETLRLYPVGPILAREVTEDVQAGKYKIPKGTLLSINIYMLHRDPEIFSEPEKFKPDRFFSENNTDLHPFSYMPFSAGARNCIGQKFAMMEMKVILAHIIRNFRIQALDPRDKIRHSWEITLKNLDEPRIRLSSRR